MIFTKIIRGFISTLPLLAPLTLLKHYLGEYPNDYLLTQNYFDPYPEELALRLMVN